MYTRVTRDQFEIRDGVFIHKPTQAEFTPNSNREDFTSGIYRAYRTLPPKR